MRKKDSLTSESEYLLAKYFMHIADGENDVKLLNISYFFILFSYYCELG
jgi:hypothetical protein